MVFHVLTFSAVLGCSEAEEALPSHALPCMSSSVPCPNSLAWACDLSWDDWASLHLPPTL